MMLLQVYLVIALLVMIMTLFAKLRSGKRTYQNFVMLWREGDLGFAKEVGALILVGLAWPVFLFILGWFVYWALVGDR